MKKGMAATILLLISAAAWGAAAANPDAFSVRDFGAVADGKTDDTAAFQKALDAAKQAGGGVVYAPRGNYFFAGHLNVPGAVTLRGIWESVPSHVGIRDRGAAKPTDDGTTFLVTRARAKKMVPHSSRCTTTARCEAWSCFIRNRIHPKNQNRTPGQLRCAGKIRQC